MKTDCNWGACHSDGDVGTNGNPEQAKKAADEVVRRVLHTLAALELACRVNVSPRKLNTVFIKHGLASVASAALRSGRGNRKNRKGGDNSEFGVSEHS